MGSYSITQGTLDNTNYNIVFIPGTFTISPSVPEINGFTDLTLTYGDSNEVQTYTSSSTGTPTYTSSNTAVATIDSSTGSITTVGVGSTTIWLSLADDGTYEPGTASMTLTINAADIATATVASIADQTYTGSAITISPTVTFNGSTVTETTDYTVSFANNTNAGTASLIRLSVIVG